MNYLSANWAQITVLLTAVGFLFKTYFEFRYKKHEIRYNLLFSEKSKEVKIFTEAFDDFLYTLSSTSMRYLHRSIEYNDFKLTMAPILNKILKSASHLRMYDTKNTELHFKVYNSSYNFIGEVKKIVDSTEINTAAKSMMLSEKLSEFINDNNKVFAIIFKDYQVL